MKLGGCGLFRGIHVEGQDGGVENETSRVKQTPSYGSSAGSQHDHSRTGIISAGAAMVPSEDRSNKDKDFIRSLLKRVETTKPKKLKCSFTSPECCIFRLASCFHVHSAQAYIPKVVSIGPLHMINRQSDSNPVVVVVDRTSLEPIQEHKWRCVGAILNRLAPRNQEQALATFVAAIRAVEEKARDCYSEDVSDLQPNEFVQMMILDGCFIIYVLCNANPWISSNSKVDDTTADGLVGASSSSPKVGTELDPLLQAKWLLSNIATDLLLVENQIPFFILERLYQDIINIHNLSLSSTSTSASPLPQTPTATLVDLALNFFDAFLPFENNRQNTQLNRTAFVRNPPLHLLDLFHSSLLPRATSDPVPSNSITNSNGKGKEKKITSGDPENSQLIPSVTRLQEAGIKFKKLKRQKGSFLEIIFEKSHYFKNSTIRMPPLVIDGCTNGLFLNLIAFEQCYNHRPKYITSYTTFLDNLINTANDVEILCRHGILENYMGNEEVVAELFNKIGREVVFDPQNFYLDDVCEKINKYYGQTWHVWRAYLHNYFKHPWSFISFLAATVLLVFTIAQTAYAIKSYKNGK